MVHTAPEDGDALSKHLLCTHLWVPNHQAAQVPNSNILPPKCDTGGPVQPLTVSCRSKQRSLSLGPIEPGPRRRTEQPHTLILSHSSRLPGSDVLRTCRPRACGRLEQVCRPAM